MLDEHFRVEGRRTWFETIEEMQAVLDAYLDSYNQRRHNSEISCQGEGNRPLHGMPPYEIASGDAPVGQSNYQS